MKLIITLLVLIFAITGCASSKAMVLKNNKLQESYKKLQAKSTNYTYTRSTSSYSGLETHTTIQVLKNEIIKREYKEGNWQSDIKNVLKTIYAENSKELNSNKKGFKAKTLEELYLQCDKNILTKSKNENSIYLKFEIKI